MTNCVEYFQSRGKSDLVAHLAAKEADYDAYGDLVRQRLEHAERTLPDSDPELADALFNAGNHAIFHQNYTEADTLLHRALDSNIKMHGKKVFAFIDAVTSTGAADTNEAHFRLSVRGRLNISDAP